jgi:putative ABC transport system substrate-binding protein
MRRRAFILALGAALLTGGIGVPLSAQTTKIARVGILSGASLSTPANARFREAFVASLRQLGWEEGKNLIVEARATEGRAERFAEHATELVALRVDVAVGSNSQSIQALKDKTSTIPIVMLDVSHPVEAGFIASLARPGGNITGLTNQLKDVDAKAFGLLREVKPGMDRAGVVYTPSNAGSALAVKQALETIPERLGVSLVPVPIDSAADIDTALAVIDREGLHALQIHPTPVINTNRARIAALLIERRVLTVTGYSILVRDGILMSYGPDQVESWRGAAVYVDRILRGAKPADLPVQQPTKFLFVINLKTAKALDLTIPPTLLARADEVIE